MKPGDIVVYRERAECFQRDKILRATFWYQVDRRVFCTRQGCPDTFPIVTSDVIRVEPSQHGWGQ